MIGADIVRRMGDMASMIEATPSFSWGTVTQAAPVRLRLDSDTASLNGAITSMVDVKTGDRVLVLLWERDAIIVACGSTNAPRLLSFRNKNEANRYRDDLRRSGEIINGTYPMLCWIEETQDLWALTGSKWVRISHVEPAAPKEPPVTPVTAEFVPVTSTGLDGKSLNGRYDPKSHKVLQLAGTGQYGVDSSGWLAIPFGREVKGVFSANANSADKSKYPGTCTLSTPTKDKLWVWVGVTSIQLWVTWSALVWV